MQPTTVHTTTTASTSKKGVKKVLSAVGVAVVVFGVAMIGLDAAIVSLVTSLQEIGTFLSILYSGIWGGALCVSAGALGIATGRMKKNQGPAMSTVAISIFGAIAAFIAMCIQGAAAGLCLLGCSDVIQSLHAAGAVMAAINFILAIVLSAYGCQALGSQGTTTGQIVISNVPAYGYPPPPPYAQPAAPPAATTFTTNY